MRRVIVSVNMTLDGYLSDPDGGLDWHFPFWNEEMSACAAGQLACMDTIVIGRVTYQAMAAYWPAAPRSGFADMMNNHAKVVFSGTLQQADWQNTRVARWIQPEISRLKASPGKDIIVYGSSSIVRKLTQLDLVDEYRIWMHPVAIGQGTALFNCLPATIDLKLIRTKTFGTGVIVLYYQPCRKEGQR